ncbi:MAG: MerR family transcriptional regulator [Rhodothermaceae bacterium]
MVQQEYIHKIGKTAELAGISVHTLRMYEKEGLIIPFQKESKQRRYSEKDVERILCIRKAINDDKMNIEGIRRLLSLIPCWKITDCPENRRKKCEAFHSSSKPCWQTDCKNGNDCVNCTVYRDFCSGESVKNKLKELLE